MANTIKIKRGSGAPSSLQDGELGFDKTGKYLYIGTETAPVNLTDFSGDFSEINTSLGTKLEMADLLDCVYPIGSIYMSTTNVSPATFLGGTWEQIQNRFLLSAGSSYTSGNTGGAASHTLTTNEMPAHNHTGSTGSAGAHTHTATTSSNGSHSHSFSNLYGGTSGVNSSYSMLQRGGAGSYQNLVTWASADMWRYTLASNGAHTHTLTTSSNGVHTHTVSITNTGGGAAFSTMPPYLVVYMWKRVEDEIIQVSSDLPLDG